MDQKNQERLRKEATWGRSYWLGLGLLGMALLQPVCAYSSNDLPPASVTDSFSPAPQIPASCGSPDLPESHPQQRPIPPPVSDAVASRCEITALGLRQMMAGRQPLVVDLRPGGAFNRAHIPGALNIPAHLIPYKSFVRSRSVVLVDDGHGKQRLLRECKRLKDKGFQRVHVLKGGLAAWASADYNLEGTDTSALALLSVTPRTLSVFLAERNWVLVADSLNSEAFPPDLAWLPRVAVTDDYKALIKNILANDGGQHRPPGVLFIATKDVTSQMVVNVARGLPDRPVRVVDGGIAEIVSFRRKHAAMLEEPAGRSLLKKRCGG